MKLSTPKDSFDFFMWLVGFYICLLFQFGFGKNLGLLAALFIILGCLIDIKNILLFKISKK